ncbi:MBG domain-containing protein [Pseudomonas sp. NFX98]|uniref:two-partner secretion domain-containing protein n=1 Tax=Pseudomonas sp. NFX98 TaxID=3399122 RepID=UPI0039FC2F47
MKNTQGCSPLQHPDFSIKRLSQAIVIALGLAGLSLSCPVAFAMDALPQQGEVISGAAKISQDGNSLHIQTQTPRTGISWQKFSIGPDNKVHFQQPDGTSVTLNRVTGGNPSNIYGMLTSNGKLILLNPAGIWFAPNSRISASALVAGAGMITDEQLKAFADSGKLDIQLKGLVRNDGQISVHDNGIVALLGAQVENNGVIQARKGQVTLATGPQASLDFQGDGLISLAIGGTAGEKESVDSSLTGGVQNNGHIEVGEGVVAMSAQRAAKHLDSVIGVGGAVIADSVSNQGGSIVLGNADRIVVSGKLSAQGSDGGNISVSGKDVILSSSADLNASGSEGKGGSIAVGGSFQGKGSTPASSATSVEKGAKLVADGARDGGQVVVWSDGTTRFAGKASAKGGDKGGIVETSGKILSISKDASIIASGGKQAGLWLLDPVVATISDIENGTDISAQSIVDSLANNDVRIEASGRINVNAPIVAKDVAAGKSLALIASGNVGQVSTYEGTDKSNDSGSVYIKAPILLKDGNLFISATGDVKLIDDALAGQTGDAAWNRRAIIDVGKGVVWIKTSNTASVTQEANTALIGKQVAVQGASVRLDSPLNHAGTLAGKATNGIFTFNQTNAGGTNVGTVSAPYSGESLDGVKAQQIKYIGSQDVIADSNMYKEVVLGQNGQGFDYLVFEATGFVDAQGKEIPPGELLRYLDSSDYLVSGLKFTDNAGVNWELKPNAANSNLTTVIRNGQLVSEMPIGFSFDANKGMVVVADPDYAPNAGWGVAEYNIAGPLNPAEIQHNSQTGASEQLVVGLGDTVTSANVLFGWLMNDQNWAQPIGDAPNRPLLERARVHFLQTQQAPESAIVLQAQQASLDLKVNDQSRQYGDDNAAFGNSGLVAQQNATAVKEVDSFVDRQLAQDRFIPNVSYSTAANERSSVGNYSINGQVAVDEYVSKRYVLDTHAGTLVIKPAPLVVTAHDQAKEAGQQDPALTYDAKGWKFSDDEHPFGLDRAPGEKPGNYSIFEKDGQRLVSANYDVTFINGVLTIKGPVAEDSVTPAPDVPQVPDQPLPTPETAPVQPSANRTDPAAVAQASGDERCSPLESPSAVIANHTASPAIVRTYSVQLICKPRSHGSAQQQLPDKAELLDYANRLIDHGTYPFPEWNRSVMPRTIDQQAKGGL